MNRHFQTAARPPSSDIFRDAEMLAAIAAIHRHTDGVITFHKKVDGCFENLFAIRAQHLESMLPEVRHQLDTDVFVSVNAYWHAEENRHYLSAAQCRQPHRLRYLCACFVDLDFYKLGLSYGQLMGMIVDFQDRGLIPRVSVVIRSGRGLWLLWLLRDDKDTRTPPRAWPEKLERYIRIQRRIHSSLANLGADARDALRIARVPGSLHSVAGALVRYSIDLDDAGRTFLYTFDELAACFGAKENTRHPKRSSATERPMSARSRGPKALTQHRMRDFLILLELRGGGFDEGCRNRAAMYYAWLLRCQRVPKDEAARQEIGRAHV